MNTVRVATTISISKVYKKLLKELAKNEHRSMAGCIEFMIIKKHEEMNMHKNKEANQTL